MEALLDLTGFAEGLVENHTYLGAYVVLVLCGFGLPIPEEVTIVGSGILLYKGVVDYWPIVAVCWAGVLTGDAVPYTVGRLWGDRAFEHRWVRRVLHKRRMERIEERFRRHLNLGVFSCRFLPGARWPGYFIAGHLGMPAWKWLTLDAIGAAIIVPIMLHLGLLFGGNLDELSAKVADLHLVLAFAAFAIVVTVVVRSRILRDRARADREDAEEAAGAATAAGEAAAVGPAGIPAPEAAERDEERPETIEGF